ncbi:MAG TPA: lysylphosphatidylglycerol synthase transmembrane domain-containing protein [Candidatus Limnocylindria bacterium]|nr:lysylphosphatidylglycerol synthase transmembrane domain-containing protein [Candidatus Limnocylindria bacterium]
MTADSEQPGHHPSGPHEHGHSVYEPGEFLGAPPEEAIPEREVSLARRFLNVRTIGSIVFGVLILVLLFRVVLDIDLGKTWAHITSANLLFLLLATLAYYATFPLRGLRWRFVLGRVGTQIGRRDATEILFLSWFVNCLVPAKLGDLYRAYLLKGNYGGSISRTVGTIFIERIADIVVIFALALAAGFWSFRGRSRPEIDALFLAGFVMAAILVLLVIGLNYFGGRLTRFLPERVAEFYARFHEGSTGALTTRSLPVIGGLTTVIWLFEGLRLFFVIRALELPDANLGISASLFVALGGSLLTAIPLTPAGVGFVEAGIVGLLTLYGVVGEPAVAVALTDRAISILTVIVFGGILYAFSAKVRRAHAGGSGAEVAAAKG